MSNLKEPLLKFDTFFDDAQKNQNIKQIFDDLYQNASFKDVILEDVKPNIKSMQNGETKIAKVGDDIRSYKRVGDSLYYSTLTRVPDVNYTKLKETDTDSEVESELWYDKSEDKLKFKTGSSVETVRSEINGYVLFKVTDTDGTVTGEIWYDDSENKLKFKTASGVETITSS